MTVSVMRLFLLVPLVGLQSVIGVVCAHAHYFFKARKDTRNRIKIQDTRSFILRRLHITKNISYKNYFQTNMIYKLV